MSKSLLLAKVLGGGAAGTGIVVVGGVCINKYIKSNESNSIDSSLAENEQSPLKDASSESIAPAEESQVTTDSANTKAINSDVQEAAATQPAAQNPGSGENQSQSTNGNDSAGSNIPA